MISYILYIYMYISSSFKPCWNIVQELVSFIRFFSDLQPRQAHFWLHRLDLHPRLSECDLCACCFWGIPKNENSIRLLKWMIFGDTPRYPHSQNGLFIMEHPIKMDDLGIHLFQETFILAQLEMQHLILWSPGTCRKKGGMISAEKDGDHC
jgi:hypothetical protein